MSPAPRGEGPRDMEYDHRASALTRFGFVHQARWLVVPVLLVVFGGAGYAALTGQYGAALLYGGAGLIFGGLAWMAIGRARLECTRLGIQDPVSELRRLKSEERRS